MRNLCDDCKNCEYRDASICVCMEVCGVPLDILHETENKRNADVGGEISMKDLISKEEALELFPLILSGELLSIGTVREQLRELQTVEAVPLSVIEKITETMEVEYASADELADWFSGGDKTEASYYRGKANGIKLVKVIIDKAVKECTHETN